VADVIFEYTGHDAKPLRRSSDLAKKHILKNVTIFGALLF
jgi:hypothetical protein